MKPNFTIHNRSDWPDAFVRELVDWIGARAGITWPYTVELPSCARRSTWSGHGGRSSCRLRMNRRFTHRFPFPHRDSRFKWSPCYVFHSRVEVFVFLLAHEMHHATPENAAWFRMNAPKGRQNRAGAEFRTNEWAMRTLEAFRAEWPAMRDRILTRWRKQRASRVRPVAFSIVDPVAANRKRLELADLRILQWERRIRRSLSALARWKRRRRALLAAQSRMHKKAASPPPPV